MLRHRYHGGDVSPPPAALAVVLAAGLALSGCAGGGGLPECGPAPAAASQPPELPPEFPTPASVTYTGDRQAGPSRVVEGYWDGQLQEAFEGYRAAFPAAGYDVVRDEIERVDAEVNFAGGGTTGQVRMLVRCRGRTNLSIVIRPGPGG